MRLELDPGTAILPDPPPWLVRPPDRTEAEIRTAGTGGRVAPVLRQSPKGGPRS